MPNVEYMIKPNKFLQKLTKLVAHLSGPSVVYCSTQREADMVASTLQVASYEAMAYHAGKSPSERLRIQVETKVSNLNDTNNLMRRNCLPKTKYKFWLPQWLLGWE